jgi:osmotically-inducible protein OsmY
MKTSYLITAIAAVALAGPVAFANGAVRLKGTVDTQAEADRAVALAKQTENVKSVNSEIIVKAPQ